MSARSVVWALRAAINLGLRDATKAASLSWTQNGLGTGKLNFYITQLARDEVDRFEYLLTGKDVH